jgi:hypothetical protein
MKPRTLAILVVLAFLILACERSANQDTLRTRASFDFQCPAPALTLTQLARGRAGGRRRLRCRRARPPGHLRRPNFPGHLGAPYRHRPCRALAARLPRPRSDEHLRSSSSLTPPPLAILPRAARSLRAASSCVAVPHAGAAAARDELPTVARAEPHGVSGAGSVGRCADALARVAAWALARPARGALRVGGAALHFACAGVAIPEVDGPALLRRGERVPVAAAPGALSLARAGERQ